MLGSFTGYIAARRQNMIMQNSANNMVDAKSHVKPFTAFMHTADIRLGGCSTTTCDDQFSLTIINQICVNGAYALAFKNAAQTSEHSPYS